VDPSCRRPPQLILANLVNEVMLAVPAEQHSAPLINVSPRKLWLADAGDIVLTPRAASNCFRRYVSSVLGVEQDAVIAMSSPPAERFEPLAEAALRLPLRNQLVAEVAARPGIELLPFVLDRPTLRLARELDVPVAGYDDLPSDDLVDAISWLNTKSGFRAAARELGLRTVQGVSCHREALVQHVESLLRSDGDVIVKLDRSSNGFGHVYVRRQALNGSGPAALLTSGLAPVAHQPPWFTCERLMPFVAVPSVEMVVTREGVKPLYLCDQRCPGGSFSGMTAPLPRLAPEVERELLHIGRAFGTYLAELGYRGVFDVDAGLTAAGEVYVTETNLRRTGGTYLDALVRRLVGDDYARTHNWIADGRLGQSATSFEAAVGAVADAGLAFDDARSSGVVLTADTVALDGKWRYLAIGRSEDEVEQVETALERLLVLA
jgi:hypothetical protein